MYDGECRDDFPIDGVVTICTADYAPVCANTSVQDPQTPGTGAYYSFGSTSTTVQPSTFDNKCLADVSGADFLYEGVCVEAGRDDVGESGVSQDQEVEELKAQLRLLLTQLVAQLNLLLTTM